eukprot:Nk52_evm36s1020 gene=Nk52_evmTU36s1020
MNVCIQRKSRSALEVTFSVIILLFNIIEIRGYRLGDDQTLCWPATGASQANEFVCPSSLNLEFVDDIPAALESQTTYNVSYRVNASDSLLNWMVSNNYFSSGTGVTDLASAKTFCAKPCNQTPVNADNCCVWHINLHTCVSNITFCSPWANGSLVTSTPSQWGPLDMLVQDTQFFVEPTSYTIIAHYKMGNIQFARARFRTVGRKLVCGDSICETARNETCSSCPKDCGQCSSSDDSTIIIAATASGGAIVLILMVVYLYLVYKKKRALEATDALWKIETSLLTVAKNNSNAASEISLASHASRLTGASDTIFSHQEHSSGSLRGEKVKIRDLPDKAAFLFSKKTINEARELYLLAHKNLCNFKAIGFEDGMPTVVVCEYAKKGSVFDVLHVLGKKSVLFDFTFMFSLGMDVAKGLQYLHKNKIVHGHLTSSNCLIWRDFSVKITDFWFRDLLFPELDLNEMEEEPMELFKLRREIALSTHGPKFDIVDSFLFTRDFFNLLWLDSKQLFNINGDCQETDIYSLGVIFSELMTGLEPFSDDYELLGAKETVKLIILGQRSNPFPPGSILLYDEEGAIDLMRYAKSLRDPDLSARPTTNDIVRDMRRENPNKDQSAVDLMVAKLDAYSQNLEGMVIEATAEARMEQERSEMLLASILPSQIIHQLKENPNERIATLHENVSVFFSDIVGFTNMSRAVSAHAVVDMLNRIFIVLDALSVEFKLTKIKTIGDAYMAACGVPDIDPKHAENVCLFALYGVKCLKHEKGTTGEPLEMRCGVHSGSLVAGIVGTRSFAFDLWGDTVNVASRMESNGVPGRVCCSQATQKLLCDSFDFEEREPREIKGQGMMVTYIVEGPKGRKIRYGDMRAVLGKMDSAAEIDNLGALFSAAPPTAIKRYSNLSNSNSAIAALRASNLHGREDNSMYSSINGLHKSNASLISRHLHRSKKPHKRGSNKVTPQQNR